MGAVDFSETAWTTASLDDTYRELCNERAHESGHGGYSGTIATTYGTHAVTGTSMTEKGASLLSEASIRGGYGDDSLPRELIPSKRESALAIPLMKDENFKFNKVTFTLDLKDIQRGNIGDLSKGNLKYVFRERALQKAFSEHSFSVADISIDMTSKFKIVVDSPKGKSTTKYVLISRNDSDMSFDTKREAVAAAKKALEGDYTPCVEIRTIKVTVDAEGNTINGTHVRKTVVSATAKVTVTLASPKKYTSDGWFFYGMAGY